jgi:hypothetical protein
MHLFTKHPRAMGESYTEHFNCASKLGLRMLLGGFACLLHAAFPFLFQQTGSRYLYQLIGEYVSRMQNTDERMMTLSRQLQEKLSECNKG